MPSRHAVIAQSRTENFPVAMWLLGPRPRRHLLAIYGFARLVDDIGDEVGGHTGGGVGGEAGGYVRYVLGGDGCDELRDEVRSDRLALLDQVERQLDAPEHPVMRELSLTVGECRLPREPLLRLIEANRRDQAVTRYDTFEELLDYCRLSAAPVGELVLHVFRAATPDRIAMSDKVCAALQVIEHLQDVEEDGARGRVYIGSSDAVARARALLEEGSPLVGTLRGRARLAVAGYVAGGRVALDALDAGADASRPAFARAYLKAVAGR